jgi:pyridoxine 5-phosphate synthase
MTSHHDLRLGLNIDHVATLRNARGEGFPCPVRAALLAKDHGVDGITAHLREDRRHIRDDDLRALRADVPLPLNMEMAATSEMQTIALEILPNAVCLVAEKREEITTEGGLDVASQVDKLTSYVRPFQEAGIRVSLFVDPDEKQLDAAKRVGADIVELHTGTYCHALQNAMPFADELQRLRDGAVLASEFGFEVHAGHGLCFETVGAIADLPQLKELNIGHFIIAESVFLGLPEGLRKMRALMDKARSERT